MKKLIALCGKSASGKDSIANKLVKDYPKTFRKKISYTTRAPREGELRGKDYLFKTDEEFFNLVADDQMYEATDFNGEMYGTGIESLKEGVVNIGIFDPVGLELISEVKDIEMVPIFIETNDKLRIKRILERDEEFSMEEIYKRYSLDEDLFQGIERFPNIVVLDNNERDLDFVVDMVWMISKHFFKFDNSKKI